MWSYLWQNFLIDTKVQNYIADKIAKIYDKNKLDCIIEIWPGKWAITKKIHNISDKFFVIEKDETMKTYLESILNKDQILFWDILESDIEKELKKRKVTISKTLIVWNLPYYITSPIFRKFFGNWEQNYFGWFFMIQDEVGHKIKTDANKKSFLRWLLNHSYNINYCKTVWSKSFNPAPKVKSCLVEFQKKEQKPDINFSHLLEFLKLYSQFSRKTLWAINKILQKQWKEISQIPEHLKSKRLEELSRNDLNFL